MIRNKNQDRNIYNSIYPKLILTMTQFKNDRFIYASDSNSLYKTYIKMSLNISWCIVVKSIIYVFIYKKNEL